MILSIKKHPVIQLVNAHLVDFPKSLKFSRGCSSSAEWALEKLNGDKIVPYVQSHPDIFLCYKDVNFRDFEALILYFKNSDQLWHDLNKLKFESWSNFKRNKNVIDDVHHQKFNDAWAFLRTQVITIEKGKI